MRLIEKLKGSEMKAKELSSLLAKDILEKGELLEGLADDIDLLDDVERGIILEAIEYATSVDPEVAEPVLDIVFECLKHEAPKVKWEAARVVGNVAHRFPGRVSRCVPNLLANSRHKGTVVRWSAAYALGEMFKHDVKARKRLRPEIDKILRKEVNNGVRNVYLKALKNVG